ncbi:MAG: hypothetical protein R6T96_15125 [Longimicrobiales bacterium]
MPSDDRITQALEAVADAREAFSSSVALSAEEVRGILEREKGVGENPQLKLAHELGPFAAGRIDLDRLTPFVSANSKLTAENRKQIQRALEVLTALKQAGDGLYQAKLPLDGYLRGGVISALGKAGAAFGAARSIEWALQDLPHPEGVEDALKEFPPDRWTRAEKGCAPPLVMEVEGQDLKISSLGELLEGSQKIVLVVNGPAAPAPLVRLITPGVTVIQTDDPQELAALSAAPGPGIAALMPEGCARFVHATAGKTIHERLAVGFLPEKEPGKALGNISAFQQAEELRQLSSLASSVQAPAAPAAEASGKGEGPEMDDAGQLAAWLIHQAKI